jgi:plastocyanin
MNTSRIVSIAIVLIGLIPLTFAWDGYSSNFNAKYGTYDGFSNIREINARTFPGDPNDAPDTKPPASITGLKNITYKPTYINWTWKDPRDADFAKVKVYINGVFKTNVSKGKMYYNSTGLIPNTLYKISTHTVDTSGNVNATWVNKTAMTAKDLTPPASITGLKNITYKPKYINWTWKDPMTFDFKYVKVYINGIFKTNVSKRKMYYNSTGLIPNTLYKISTHTVDTSGNVNATWVNKTARTAPLIAKVSIMDFSYNPQTLKVSRYTTVIWKNNDMADHTVTSDSDIWNSGDIMNGKSYSRRFNSVGIFGYHCDIHPSMKGTVNVTT